jgi:hypothetical protein
LLEVLDEFSELGEFFGGDLGVAGEVGDEGGDGAAECAVDEIADEVAEEDAAGDAGGVEVETVNFFAGKISLGAKARHDVKDGGADDAAGGGEVIGDVADGDGVVILDEGEDLEFGVADGGEAGFMTTHVVKLAVTTGVVKRIPSAIFWGTGRVGSPGARGIRVADSWGSVLFWRFDHASEKVESRFREAGTDRAQGGQAVCEAGREGGVQGIG